MLQGHLNFILAKRKIHEECKLSEQCTGTDYVNNCFKKGKDENEKGVCTCNNRYDLINGKCLKGRVYNNHK